MRLLRQAERHGTKGRADVKKEGEAHMKRNIVLLVCVLLLCALLPQAAQAGYTAAFPSENREVYPSKLGDGMYNLLLNGDMEKVDESGVPVKWEVSHAVQAEGAYFMTASGNAMDGENFAVISGKEGGRVYFMQTLSTLVAGETYAFSAYMRKISGAANPMLYIDCQKPSGTSHTTIKTYYHTIAPGGSWEKVEYSFKVVEETTRVLFRIRLDGEAEFHVDSASLAGKAPETVRTAVDFRDTLRAEAAVRESLEVSFSGSSDGSTVPGQPDNILTNGTLESDDGVNFSGWGRPATHASYLSVAENASRDGSDCIRFSVPAGNGLKHPYYYQIQNLVGGAEYELSFWYKVIGGSAVIKLEYFTDRSLPGAVSCGGRHFGSSIQDGEWHYYSETIYPPSNAQEATVLARLLQSAETVNAEAYIDDIQIRMTNPPSPLEFDTGSVFFYADETEGVLSSSVNLQYFPELAGAKVDFEILDGSAVIWSVKNLVSSGGKATVPFSLSLLHEMERPYIAKATLYDTDGTVMEVKTQQIYKYNRPAYLGKDGIYRKNGSEPFYPIYAYHVNAEHYAKAAEGGVNVVQMGSFNTAEQALAALDKAQQAGIMGFIALYYGMTPAGSHENIERTIGIVGDERVKNHPALFGYGVMDEVFLGLTNPQLDMENSFRLLRLLDDKHPIMAMEAVSTYYKETGKYVDILCIDPYSSAAGQNASRSTALAREAVGYKKPVYSLLETYYNTHGRWPLPEDGRNNNWQALLSGAAAVGYFTISDSDVGENNEEIPIWDARDDGALWNALCTFGEREKQIAYDHFVFDKTPAFCEKKETDYWYAGWIDGGSLYMIVLGLKEEQEKAVSIPLESFAGDIKIGAYTAEIVAGRENAPPIIGSDTLELTVSGVEAVLFKITPSVATDFSALGSTKLEDLADHGWARQQIARLNSLGIAKGRSDWEYAPGEAVSGMELKSMLETAVQSTLTVEPPAGAVTIEDALSLCRAALAKAVFSVSPDAARAQADIAATLRVALRRGGETMGETVTRAQAAVLIERVLYWKENPEKIAEFAGMSKAEAERLSAVMSREVDAGTTNGSGWLFTENGYVYILNTASDAAEIAVNTGGQYAKLLCGGAEVTLSASSMSITVPACSFAVLRVADEPPVGLYVGNVAYTSLRPGVSYTVRGGVAARYAVYDGTPELLAYYPENSVVQIKAGESVRVFAWDALLRPKQN